MTFNYYINNDYIYVYNKDINQYSIISISNNPAGYYCSTVDGIPDSKYLVKANVDNPDDFIVYSYDGIRENHEDYWWNYDKGVYVYTPNDDRFLCVEGTVIYRHDTPRYRVYLYRGDYYIWCCDEKVIRRVHCEDHKVVIDSEFPANNLCLGALMHDWTFLAEFSNWIDCFVHRRIRYKTAKEMFSHENSWIYRRDCDVGKVIYPKTQTPSEFRLTKEYVIGYLDAYAEIGEIDKVTNDDYIDMSDRRIVLYDEFMTIDGIAYWYKDSSVLVIHGVVQTKSMTEKSLN